MATEQQAPGSASGQGPCVFPAVPRAGFVSQALDVASFLRGGGASFSVRG